jgi:hypothetical protein
MKRNEYPRKAGFARGSETSRMAAEAIEPRRGTQQAKVLGLIKDAGLNGLTDHELELQVGLKHQTSSARRRELVLKGLVVPKPGVDGRRLGGSGLVVQVWVASQFYPNVEVNNSTQGSHAKPTEDQASLPTETTPESAKAVTGESEKPSLDSTPKRERRNEVIIDQLELTIKALADQLPQDVGGWNNILTMLATASDMTNRRVVMARYRQLASFDPSLKSASTSYQNGK